MRNSVISISYPRMDRKLVALGGETISINVMLDDLRTYGKFFVHGGEVISITFVRGGNRTDEKSAPIINVVFIMGAEKMGADLFRDTGGLHNQCSRSKSRQCWKCIIEIRR